MGGLGGRNDSAMPGRCLVAASDEIEDRVMVDRDVNPDAEPRAVEPRRRRRRGVRIAVVLALAAAFAAVLGCTSTITAPHDPPSPTKIIVLAEAMHRGLLLPDGTGSFVEYGFGEWSWYALGEDAWYRVFPVVLWPSTGALCRREHHARDLLEVKATMPWVRLQELVVSGDRVRLLRERLEREFTSRAAESVWQSRYAMRFLPNERAYWWASNCTDQVADWLRELDCEVSWVPLRLDLVVD